MRSTLSLLGLLLLALAPAFLVTSPAAAQQVRDGIETRRIKPFILSRVDIVRQDVFDSTTGIPLITPLLDYIHILTKERVIRDEVFVDPGDTVTQHTIDEIERNLHALTIFSMIDFAVIPDSSEADEDVPHAVLKITTRDSWSTRVGGSYSKDNNQVSYGANVKEVNLFGYGHQLNIGADYTSLYDRGWRLTGSYTDPNIARTHLHFTGAAAFSKYEQSTAIGLGRAFYSDRVPVAYNAAISHFDGDDFFFLHSRPAGSPLTIHARRTDVFAWGAQSRGWPDLFRTSLAITFNKTERDSFPLLRYAFENSVGVFAGISSLGRTYARIWNADFHGRSEVPIGGMGSVTIGKISPINGGLDNVAYIGAEARKAIATDNLYAFAGVQAGTGVAKKEAAYTLERTFASGALGIDPGWLVARLEQTTVWRWPRYLFQPLDNGTGLRGYTRNALFGDNKFVGNLEYRLMPIFDLLMFQFGAAAFYDIGSVWDQGEQLGDLRFHSSAGFGIRVANRRGTIDKGLLRVDVAYNFDERRFAQIIISSSEAFDVFGTLDYRPPAPYVP